MYLVGACACAVSAYAYMNIALWEWSCGAYDMRCMNNLRLIWTCYKKASHGKGLAAGRGPVPKFVKRLRCPRSGEPYEWHAGTTKTAGGLGILVVCRGHRESVPGWDLSRDSWAFVLLENGEIAILPAGSVPPCTPSRSLGPVSR